MKKKFNPVYLFGFSCLLVAQIANGQVRTYEVIQTATPPAIDGTVSAGEWDAAATTGGDWSLLRTPAPGIPDAENSRFRATWDANNLYLLFESDYGGWNAPTGGGGINFGADNINIYFDPNADGEPNVGGTVDGYQIAFNQPMGSTGGGIENSRVFTEAHVNTAFGNQGAPWSGFANSTISQNNDANGGVVELSIPWTDFNAAENHPDETGLFHPMAPQPGDEWFLNMGRISSDNTNFLPIWQYHTANPFAVRPHGILTFVPEPSALVLLLFGLVGLRLTRRK